jgi:hypothetical protein
VQDEISLKVLVMHVKCELPNENNNSTAKIVTLILFCTISIEVHLRSNIPLENGA